MRLIDRFSRRAVTDIGGSWVNFDQGPLLTKGATTAGQQVNQDTAKQLLAVYGSTTLIANSIASLPVQIVQPDGEPLSPLPMLAEWPNPEKRRVEFITEAVMSLLFDGNLYLAIERDDASRVRHMWVLDPTQMDLVKSPAGSYRVTHGGRPVDFEVSVMRGLVAPGSEKGLSPIDYARQMIGIGLGAQEQAARFFAQGTITPGVIESDGTMTVEQMREVKNQWLAAHGGSRRAHLPVVLSNAQFKPIAMTWEQAQFLESRKWTDAQIAGQVFHLDPSMLGIPVEGNSLTYQTLETRNADFVRRSLLPWIIRLETVFTGLLPAKQQWKFNVDGLLRADLRSRYDSYKTAAEIQSLTGDRLLTVDEMRRLENLRPLEG